MKTFRGYLTEGTGTEFRAQKSGDLQDDAFLDEFLNELQGAYIDLDSDFTITGDVIKFKRPISRVQAEIVRAYKLKKIK